MAKLSFTAGEGEEKSYRLLTSRPLRIGRDPSNDVILRDAKVSRTHAEIVFERGFFVIKDLGSSNGTFVNGVRVRVAPLTDGAELKLGNTFARFSEELSASASGVPPVDEGAHTAPQEMASKDRASAPAVELASPSDQRPAPSGASEFPSTQIAPQSEVHGDEPDASSAEEGGPVAASGEPEPVAPASPEPAATAAPVNAPAEPGRHTLAVPMPAPKSDEPPAREALPFRERIQKQRFLIDSRIARGELMTIRDEHREPLFFFRPHVTLISFVANLLAAIIVLTGVAACIFLAWEGRVVPAGAAVALTVVFSAVIISLAPRRFIHVFGDAAATARELSVWEENRLPFPVSRFSGRGGDGAVFAVFEKRNMNPLGRRRWWVLDRRNDSRIGYAVEDSLVRSLARKAVGNFFSALRPNYTLYVGVRRCGFVDRRSEGGEHVVLDLSDDPGSTLDRRIALALALLITAVEK